MTVAIGHNNPPKDRAFKKRWVNALFDVPKKPYGSIAMAFKIYMEMDSRGFGATISDDEFRASCGISDGSCRIFKKWLVDREFIRIQVRGQRGRKSTFQATIPGEIPASTAAIKEEIPAPIAVSPEEYRRPLPSVETEIPATAAAIGELAAPAAGIPASRALACLEPPKGVLPFVDEEAKGSKNTPLPPTIADGPTPLDAQNAFDAYNEVALRCGLQQAAKLTKARQRSILARLKDYGMQGWVQALGNIEKSAFLQGANDRGFRANLDFMCQASRFDKLHDGAYGNGAHAQPKETEFEKIGRWVKEADERQQQRRIT